MIQEIIVSEKQVLVIISGSIFIEEATQIYESLTGYIENGHKKFIIDLGDVYYINSAGVETLDEVQKKAMQNGGSVALKGLNGFLRDLFELTRLDKVFEIQ